MAFPRLKSALLPTLFFAAFLAFWEASIWLFRIPAYLLPSPREIGTVMWSMRDVLLKNSITTATEAVFGFLIGCGIGIFLSALFVHSRMLRTMLAPYVMLLRIIPTIVLVPFLIIWFGNGIWSKVIAAAVLCIFPTMITTMHGFSSIDKDALDLFKSLSASKTQIFLKLRVPMALPFIFSAFKIAAPLSVIGVIVAEFVGANEGLGFLMTISLYSLNTAMMFSSVLFVALVSVLFYWCICAMESRIVCWNKIVESDVNG